MEGTEAGLWEFADPIQGLILQNNYKVSMLTPKAEPQPGVITK
jgi:hypothetical protein